MNFYITFCSNFDDITYLVSSLHIEGSPLSGVLSYLVLSVKSEMDEDFDSDLTQGV